MIDLRKFITESPPPTLNQVHSAYQKVVDLLATDLSRITDAERLYRAMYFGNILIAKYRSDYIIVRDAYRGIS